MKITPRQLKALETVLELAEMGRTIGDNAQVEYFREAIKTVAELAMLTKEATS